MVLQKHQLQIRKTVSINISLEGNYVVNVVGELGTLFDVFIWGWLAELGWVEFSWKDVRPMSLRLLASLIAFSIFSCWPAFNQIHPLLFPSLIFNFSDRNRSIFSSLFPNYKIPIFFLFNTFGNWNITFAGVQLISSILFEVYKLLHQVKFS